MKQDLGDLGPADGIPLTFHWSLWWTLAPWLCWLWFLPLMALPGNRRREAWWILAPVLLEAVVIGLLNILLHGGSALDTARQIGLVFAAFLLLAEPLSRLSGGRRIAAAIPIYALAAFLLGLGGGMQSLVTGAAGTWMAGVVLLPVLVKTAHTVRRRPAGSPVLPWLLLWTVSGMVIAALITAVFMLLSMGGGHAWVLVVILGIFLTSMLTGLVLWLILVPFFLLASRVPLYAERMRKLLSL